MNNLALHFEIAKPNFSKTPVKPLQIFGKRRQTVEDGSDDKGNNLFTFTDRVRFGPPGGGTVYRGSFIPTPQSTADLLAGKWTVTVTTRDFSTGELAGRITQVPEPSTFALGTLEAILIFARMRRWNKKAAV